MDGSVVAATDRLSLGRADERVRDLTSREYRMLWRSARRACGGLGLRQPDIEDCVQSALISFCHLPRTESDGIENPGRWVATVARYRAIDEVRRQGSRHRAETAFGRRYSDVCPDLADDVAGAAEARCLVALLSDLPLATRRALCELSNGYTAAEAADRLGTSRRSVESHRYRARRHLAAVGAAP